LREFTEFCGDVKVTIEIETRESVDVSDIYDYFDVVESFNRHV
jgi:hypothetical protein